MERKEEVFTGRMMDEGQIGKREEEVLRGAEIDVGTANGSENRAGWRGEGCGSVDILGYFRHAHPLFPKSVKEIKRVPVSVSLASRYIRKIRLPEGS